MSEWPCTMSAFRIGCSKAEELFIKPEDSQKPIDTSKQGGPLTFHDHLIRTDSDDDGGGGGDNFDGGCDDDDDDDDGDGDGDGDGDCGGRGSGVQQCMTVAFVFHKPYRQSDPLLQGGPSC